MVYIVRSFFILATLFVFSKITGFIINSMYDCYVAPSDVSKAKESRYVPAERRQKSKTQRKTAKKPSATVMKKKRTAMGESQSQDSNYSTYQAIKNRYK
ncbi:hypothetical protein [Filifactor villosus]|uniref:Uncharacterized protein n=1 Tax=Filifactor villosus TaxID=29374 RepID=A0ABV9QIE6_9FIRM